MTKKHTLQPGCYYHIYNKGVNGENLFKTPDHYSYFLRLYVTYIDPVAETYAWVLMPNHFHLLIKIKENICYKYSATDKLIMKDEFENVKWLTCQIDNDTDIGKKIPNAYLHLSHMFNSYSKSRNKTENQNGKLFQKAFKRKLVDNKVYHRNLLIYIHNNPVHHGFCADAADYHWSSYHSVYSVKETKLNRDTVKSWFKDESNYEQMHSSHLINDETGCDFDHLFTDNVRD